MEQSRITQKRPRIAYIDIAKGILIMCMLYGHIRVYGPMEGMNDPVMHIMSHTSGLYGAFFMQSFFIITGFCTSFTGGVKYIWKNIKTLLIPSILLFLLSEYYKVTFFQGIIDLSPFRKLFDWLTVGGPWFIIALFWAKLLYYLICKLGIKYQVALLLILYLFALACNFFNVTNYQWFQHTLLLMPYLFVGKICRENWMKIEPKLKYIAYFGLVTILLENILSQCGVFSLPEQDFAICISFKNFPLHIVNSLSGTAFVIYASKLIGTNNFIQTMGTGTLLCYLWNGIVYRTIVRGIMSGYNTDNIIICSLFHLVALTLCYFIFYNLIKLIYQHKYLKWIVGKWKVFII